MKGRKRMVLLTVLMLVVTASVFAVQTFAYAEQPQIPATTEDYTLTDTVAYGNFEGFNAGMQFGTANTATQFWGSVELDHPGVIVDLSGNKALRLKKSNIPGKAAYASAFVLTNANVIRSNEFLTVEFEYKLNVENAEIYAGESVTMAFIGANAGLGEHHRIMLNGSNPNLTVGDNTYKWPVTFTTGTNDADWTKVSCTVYTENGTMATNSIRWLFPILGNAAADDEMLIDNVKIIRWVDNRVEDLTPVITGENALSFNKKSASDVTVTINTKGVTTFSLRRGGTNINAAAYEKSQNGDICTLTLKKDYLSTLDDGEHTFTLNNLNGTVEFTVTVKNVSGGGCNSAVTIGSYGLLATAVITLLAAVILFAPKRRSRTE